MAEDTTKTYYSVQYSDLVTGPQVLYNKLVNINNLPNEMAYTLIRREYKTILSNVFNDPIFEPIKESTNFVIALTQVCIEVELTFEERINCNAIIYKEIAKAANPYLQKLYYILGLMVNKSVCDALVSNCGIEQALASFIAVSRKSSIRSSTNIIRMNYTISCINPNIMTVQRITDIYSVLFNYVNEIKQLFVLIMKDVYVYNSDEDWITADMLKTNDNMTMAILSILESLELENIEDILTEYHKDIEINRLDEDDLRYHLSTLDPEVFPKIHYIYKEMLSKSIYIP